MCDDSAGGFTKDTQWLVWNFESDCTLGDALDGVIGTFPADVEELVVGRTMLNATSGRRDAAVIRKITKQVLIFSPSMQAALQRRSTPGPRLFVHLFIKKVALP
jgi:hypothetical protein